MNWIRDQSSLIWTPDPVNREDPVNAALMAQWMVIPGVTGGRYVPDLLGRYHGNITSSGRQIQSTYRPGGFGHINGVSGSGAVAIPDNGAFAFTNQTFGLSFWIFNRGDYGAIVSRDEGGTQVRGWTIRNYSTYMFFTQWNGASYNNLGTGGTHPWAVNTWYHVHVNITNSTASAGGNRVDWWVNGKYATGANGSTVVYSPATDNTLRILQEASGAVDDVRIHGRALSAAEIDAIYDDSRTGHDRSIRWFSLATPLLLNDPLVGSAATATLAATLNAATLSSGATAAVPAGSSGTLAKTLNAATLSSGATAAAPAGSTATLAKTLNAATLASAATAAVPPASSATLAKTLNAATLASTATAAAAGSATATLAVTLAAATLSSTATAAVPAGSSGTLAKTLNAATLASVATAAAAGAATGTLAATLQPATLAATAVPVTGVSASLAASLQPAVLISTATTTGTVLVVRRDDFVLRDIADRLRATGLFAEVSRGVMPSERDLPADYTVMGWLRRRDWTETQESATDGHERTVMFDLTIAATGIDPDLRHDRLCQAEAVARNAINRRSLAGFTMPAFSMLEAGRDERSGDGFVRVTCRGRFRYLVNGTTGLDESEVPL